MKPNFILLLLLAATVSTYSQTFDGVQKTPLKTLTLSFNPENVLATVIPGKVIVTSATKIILLDIVTGKETKSIALKQDDFDNSFGEPFEFCRAWVSSDGKYMLVSTIRKFRLYTMEDWTKPVMESAQMTQGAAFSPGNKQFYTYENKYYIGKEYEDTSSINGYVYTWDIATKKSIKKTPVRSNAYFDVSSENLMIKQVNGQDIYCSYDSKNARSSLGFEINTVNLITGASTIVQANPGMEMIVPGTEQTGHSSITMAEDVFYAAPIFRKEAAAAYALDIKTGERMGFVTLNRFSGTQNVIHVDVSPAGKYLCLKYQATDNPEGSQGFAGIYTIVKSGSSVDLIPYKLFPASDGDMNYFCVTPDEKTLVIISKFLGNELTVWNL